MTDDLIHAVRDLPKVAHYLHVPAQHGSDAVLARMNAFGRIAVCGLIAGYNDDPIPVTEFRSVLTNRLKIQGFIVSEHPDAWPPALAELAQRIGDGTLRYRETIARGLDAAPAAFIGLLRGENLGKQLVALD